MDNDYIVDNFIDMSKKGTLFLILDIGCGNRPTGHVNCDVNIAATPHRDITLNVRKIPNFVRCDAKHLPFKDESFEEAYASHLIEHFSDPSNVLREMIRVARDKITIIVPHRVARKRWLKYEQDRVHKQLFCAITMMQWLDNQKLAYQIDVIKHSFPNDVIPLVNLPWQIRVEIRKTD